MYSMEWSIQILTKTHLLYHWKFFVVIQVQMEEEFWIANSTQDSLGCSLLVLTLSLGFIATKGAFEKKNNRWFYKAMQYVWSFYGLVYDDGWCIMPNT